MSGIGVLFAAAGAAPANHPALALGALGGLGFPELMVILMIFALLVGVPTVVIVLIVGWGAARRGKLSTVASKPCPHCGQRIPDIGAFCPLCGQRIA